ncbi:MAG TPA: molybdenum ABC transporter ATP-binding protein [Methylocella sp.]|nr:molybdenum ABC transporter ATP-binding protein [Methylocella sp.]
MNNASGGARIVARFKLSYSGFELDARLDLPGKKITILFGHSGSGKTTLLRCMAGLIRAPNGFMAVGPDLWQDEAQGIFLPVHRRPIGLVFQDANLFPHLSVLKNLRYGMRRAGAGDARDALGSIVSLLSLEPLLGRMPETLSGGERQRVAIARALLTRPRLLLLDEPLASLDFKRKLEILPYLERLRSELDIPIVYVTHSPDEVARLGDHLVIMEGGSPLASGALAEVLTRVDLPSAFLDEAGTVLDVKVGAHEGDGLTRLDFEGGAIHVARRKEAVGQTMRCRVHARDVSIALARHDDTSILNILPATVADIGEAGTPGHVLVLLILPAGAKLLARITSRSCRLLGLKRGLAVWAQVKAVAILG